MFLGLNALRLISLVVIILVFTTLVMGLVEDVRDYHNDAIREEAQTDDCAYLPGTSIPMQTWGIFWVEFHRSLLLLGAAALFLAELSWFGISRLEQTAQSWFPLLSRTRGLAALGCVHIVLASSILSHYLDEFPLVVSWMLFVIGLLYLCLGVAFHSYPLKDGRSLFTHKRSAFAKGFGHDHVYRTFGRKKDYLATTSSDKSFVGTRKLFKPKGPVSIHETFPSLETESHSQVLAERARQAEHRRKASSVAVDMGSMHTVQSSLMRDFEWNTGAAVAHERGQSTTKHDEKQSCCEMHQASDQRCDSRVSDHSCSAASIASSTQIRIGGYTTTEAARARERAKKRRAAANAAISSANGVERSCPPASRSKGHSAKASKMNRVKRRSIAFVNTARRRLSAGTTSALAARRRFSSALVHGFPNSETEIVIEYINDESTAPPMPPLPAYHQATRSGVQVDHREASSFADSHVV